MKLINILKELLIENKIKLSPNIIKAIENISEYPSKGTKEYNDAENILEAEMMIEDIGNEKLVGNFKFQDLLLKVYYTKNFFNKFFGWKKYFDVPSTDFDTMIGIYGHFKNGYTQSENTLKELFKLIKNHVNEFNINIKRNS